MLQVHWVHPVHNNYTKVFRIEDSSGRSVYTSEVANLLSNNQDDRSRHPPPENDSLLIRNLEILRGGSYIHSSYLFGFISVDQLRAWIYNDEMLWNLHDNKFKVSIYFCKPESVILGNAQCIFTKDAVLNEAQHSLPEFFNL